MQIDFAPNARPTLGIELELSIVDQASGELVSAASDILGDLGSGHEAGEHPKAKHELFECTIEIITDVCSTAAEARTDLQATLDEVRAAADRRGLTLISAGTHPFSLARDQDISANERYHALVEEMQWTARRLLICGTHYHVAVRSAEKAVVVFNEVQRYLPLFLILSASSPFLEDEDTGLASVRSKVFESLPTAGLPPQVLDWGDFEAFMKMLLQAKCINSIREVWWDIRPHPDFGTVELRMCDAAPTLREVTALAALAQALVAWIDERDECDELPDHPREWLIRENRWLAARHGAEASLIVDNEGVRRPARELIEELVDALGPTAERLGSTAELADVLTILDAGPGYVRQRRVLERGGTMRDVVSTLVRELVDDRPDAP